MVKMQMFNSGFNIDQLIAASEAARNFSSLRKSAKLAPRLILENNKPDSVLLSIEDYQFMQEAIATLQDEIHELKSIDRILHANDHDVKKHSFSDFATTEDKEIVREAKEWDISDEELFEGKAGCSVKNKQDAFPKLLFWEEAKEEWLNLDGHQKKFVSKALQRIEENGSTIGEPLGKKRTIDLTGYRKVKLRKLGIRIVYNVKDGIVEVTEIVAIGDGEDEEVYREAFERIVKRKNNGIVANSARMINNSHLCFFNVFFRPTMPPNMKISYK